MENDAGTDVRQIDPRIDFAVQRTELAWNHMQGTRAIARMSGRTAPRVTAAELAAVLVVLVRSN